jgi:hypothetical protein
VHGYAKSMSMPTDPSPAPKPPSEAAQSEASGKRTLPAAAERALAEAAARRPERDRSAADAPKEVNGRGGPEPTRYGDWEVGGIASDF